MAVDALRIWSPTEVPSLCSLRSIHGRDTARGNLEDEPVEVVREGTPGQESYAQMLRLFAETLEEQNSLLLFVSS